MEYSPLRDTNIDRTDKPEAFSKMSTLTMPFPQHHPGFHREFSWQQEARTPDVSRPRNDNDKIALPSIRQVRTLLRVLCFNKADCPNRRSLNFNYKYSRVDQRGRLLLHRLPLAQTRR